MSNKHLKNSMKKTKTISLIGASRKLGVTHISLALANFLQSALKRKVLYIELAQESQLLGVVGENLISVEGYTAFLFKGVIYALACNVDEAIKLLKNFDGYVIVDISKFSEQTKVIFDQCENKIVIGSMKPWCKKDLYEVAMKLKGGQDMKSIKYYNLGKNKNEIIEFKKYFNCNMAPLPVIDNPFSLKERDFAFLLEMLK